MDTTRQRGNSARFDLGLQDFGALPHSDAAVIARMEIPSAAESALAHDGHSAVQSMSLQTHSEAAVVSAGEPDHLYISSRNGVHIVEQQTHFVVSPAHFAPDAAHWSNASWAPSAGGTHFAGELLSSAANATSLLSSAADTVHPTFGRLGAMHELSAHDLASGAAHGEPSHFYAPPPATEVFGQLWFAGQGSGTGDDDVGHIDSDAAGRDSSDVDTTEGHSRGFSDVGLDTAAGLYFGMDTDGYLRSGHITNDQETNEASEIQEVLMISDRGTGFDDEVNALAVDPIHDVIYMGLWGQTDATTGILEITYNPTTGALTSPYTPNSSGTGTINNTNHVLFEDDSSGNVGGVAFSNVVGMDYDIPTGLLYYADMTGGGATNGGSGIDWSNTNGIYVVSTTGSVGGGNSPTPTELTNNTQFATDSTGFPNNYISAVAVDSADNLVYFTVNDAASHTSKIYYVTTNGGAHQTAVAVSGSFGLASYFYGGSNNLTFDPDSHTLYVSDNIDSTVIAFTLNSGTGYKTVSSQTTLFTFDSANGGSSTTGLYFDPMPTLSQPTGTTTEAVQGGSALTLLTAAPTISDPNGSNMHMGFAQIVVANAQAGDELFFNGLQSGSSSGVAINWNSTTHTLTLTGNLTQAAYDTIFTEVSFQDTGTDNSTGSHPTRTIDWIISDGTTITDETTADRNDKATTVVIDRAPTLTADSYTNVLESSTITKTSGTAGTGVLGNDTDKDGDAITVTALNGSAANLNSSTFTGSYGHFDLQANGSFVYTADLTSNIDNAATGSHPVDTFTYTVSDGLGGVTTSTVSFTVDRAPNLVADNPTGQALESGSGITGNVLTNDTDKDGDILKVIQIGGSAVASGVSGSTFAGTYGDLTIHQDGSYTYTADNASAIDAAATGSHLTDTFTYTVDDSHGSNTLTQALTVTIDRAPTVVNDVFPTIILEGGSTGLVDAASGVLANDSDRDSDPLTVSAISGGTVGTSTATTYGHITLNANGSYTYTADSNSAIDAAPTGSHPVDTISFTVSDGVGGTTSETLNITIDRAPTVAADGNADLEGATVNVPLAANGVLANDTDKDGDTLTVSAISGGTVGVSTATTYGHITLNADGTYSYVADDTSAIDAAATGSHPIDTITFTVSDGLGGTTSETLNITIDRAPTVVADNNADVEGATVNVPLAANGVLANDTDKDGDGLTVSAISGGTVGVSTATMYGHITLNADGTYSYVADDTSAIDNAVTGSHPVDTISFTVDDGHGGTTNETLNITIDRAPTVVNDNGNDGESGTLTVDTLNGVLTNDTDKDGDGLVVSAISGGTVGSSTATTYGHITLNADGSYTYVADDTSAIDNASTGSHPVDTISFTVDDSHGGTTNETLNITIDRPAVAAADSLDTAENAQATVGSGSPVNANLLTNDVDKDGDAITITDVNGSNLNVGTQITLASGALLTVNSDGTYTYDPNHVFDYLAAAASGASDTQATDTFTYTVDGGSTVTVTITINGVDSNDTLIGTSGNDTINGGVGDDIFYDDNGAMSGTDPHDTSAGKSGGTDSFSGAAGNDSFYMGANLTAADQIDGGANTDTVYLDGDYSGGLVFNATTMVNVEFLNLAAGNSYDLTLAGETAAAGQTFTIQAGQLGGGDTLTIDGSAVAGNLVINAGSGDAVLTGGSGNDVFRSYGGTDTISGGGGNDVINLRGTFTAADHIDGGTGIDTLYLNGNYSAGVTFDAATLTNVEVIALADSGSYSLTIDNATVAAGDTLTLQGRSLTVGHNVVFDGSADTTGGNLIINTGGGNDVLTGGNGDDIFRPGSGTDTIHGGGGDDVVNMGAFLTAADKIDGGSGVNTVYLDGDYSGGVTFNATTMVNIESIRLAAGHSYSLTMDNATVAAGQTLFANASTLSGGDHFDFDGSADTSGGSFNITGGAGNDSLIGGWAADVLNAGSGNDTLQGGGGADTLVGGPGADHFVYNQVSDSTGLAHDRVTDFDASADFFKFTGDTVTAIDAAVNGGKLTEGNFDGLLAKYVGAGQLGAHHAVLFTPDAGVYHDHVFLIVDANGVAGYQAGQDYVIDITGATNLNDLATGNFTH